MEQLSQELIDGLINKNTVSAKGKDDKLTEMQLDALGESVNISMGAAAKVLSSMLNLKVLITTPVVTVVSSESFEYKSLFPAVGVKINYVEGLSGVNFFVLKQDDVKYIADIMMGKTGDDVSSEFTELHSSAASEIMNQMMGASSTSLATFFNRKINISTPECVLMEKNTDSKEALAVHGEVVVVKLRLMIGEAIDSEFINVIPIDFAREIAENLINVQLPLQTNSVIKNEPETNNNVKLAEKQQDEQVNRQTNNSGNSGQSVMKASQKGDDYSPVEFKNLNDNNYGNGISLSNLNVIMDVPLEVTVQIGKASKQVKEIIEFTQGSIIELEKQAGDPVDIIVNGELIARGDVVVIDDNFGVRITEIIKNKIGKINGVI